MNDYKSSKYIDDCYAELERKQAALMQDYSLDAYGMFDYDLNAGRIQFKQGVVTKVEADFIPVGSFSEEAGSWMWAWANASVRGALLEQAESLKELEAKTGEEIFGNSTFPADAATAWEMAAIACDHFNGQGVFAAPVQGLLIFMVLNNLTRV
ncbi:MAG TPA: hypothetical protein ENI99_01340 [Sedimenticola sp.]|nr:hypothetical protein [Sedimenticola sp.]